MRAPQTQISTPTRTTRSLRWVRSSASLFSLPALVILGFLVVGCSDDVGGPGELTGTLQSPGTALGAAVLEVTGKGVTGFSGAGTTQVFFAPKDEEEGSFRVVLMSSSSSGPLQFRVSVEDTGAKKPSTSVVSLTSLDNLPVPATADYSVTFTK